MLLLLANAALRVAGSIKFKVGPAFFKEVERLLYVFFFSICRAK